MSNEKVKILHWLEKKLNKSHKIDFDILNKLHFEQLPEGGVWTESQKKKYLSAYKALLDALILVKE